MANRSYDYTRRNEYGDEFRWKSGQGANAKWTGTRVCLGKKEKKVFTGDCKTAIDLWAEWSHGCERDAPESEPAPVVPRGHRVEEDDVPKGKRTSDEDRAEIEELLEAGDMTQAEIASAYGVCQRTVANINAERLAKQQRHEERQRVRDEERRLRAEEAERNHPKPEPLPEGFRPKVAEETPATYYAITCGGSSVTLFTNAQVAGQVAAMMNSVVPEPATFMVVECKMFEDGPR